MQFNWKHSSHWVLGIALASCPVALLGQGSYSGTAQPGKTNSATAQSDSMAKNGSMSASDKTFVKKAAEGGLAEVELGKLATEKAANEEVKKFGQKMVDDHTKANDQLKQVASSQGIELPTTLSAKDKMTKERLEKLTGANFDKAYMRDMVKDHRQDVAEFTKESNSGKDEAVKQFASSTLPKLKEHLQDAEKIQPATKSSSSGASK